MFSPQLDQEEACKVCNKNYKQNFNYLKSQIQIPNQSNSIGFYTISFTGNRFYTIISFTGTGHQPLLLPAPFEDPQLSK